MRRPAPLVLALTLLAAVPAFAAEKPAAKPAAPPPSGADARDPTALIGVLAGLGAKAELAKSPPAGKVQTDVQTPGGGFGLQFVDCDPKGKACHAVVFSTAFDRKGLTLTQINGFNRQAVVCRGFLGEDNRPNLAYAALLTARLNTDDLKQQVGVWQGCLADFAAFTADPTAFLMNADR